MVNLGIYSGANCPNVRFQPTVIDRALEVVALLILLLTLGSVYWLYTQYTSGLATDVWVMAGTSIFCFLLLGVCAYTPARLINFPVRVNERNIGIQYLLAVRLLRIMNILTSLMFLASIFVNYYKVATILLIGSLVLLTLSFLVYYVIAFKYK